MTTNKGDDQQGLNGSQKTVNQPIYMATRRQPSISNTQFTGTDFPFWRSRVAGKTYKTGSNPACLPEFFTCCFCNFGRFPLPAFTGKHYRLP